MTLNEINVHESNLRTNFVSAVLDELNNPDINTIEQAFNRVVAKWLGYELEESMFVDGAGDRGIDFWFASTTAFDIFQIKTHNLTEIGEISKELFGHEGVSDLVRVKNFLIHGSDMLIKNKKLKYFRQRWDHAVSSRKLSLEEISPITVNLYLILVGEGLTVAAKDEFDGFSKSITVPTNFNEVPIQFTVKLITVKDIITEKWRKENRDWVNIEGHKKDWMELHPDKGEWLKGTNSAVFYCPAIDLVNSYREYGYQIFEPNVRCNITKSKVNQSIQDSVKHQSSRRDFRYLNNGVTIICSSFSNPSSNRNSFKILEPGIVNGLQTVVSVTEAYYGLSDQDKKDFEKKCFILVRLLRESVVKDISKVVQATNTQNPMQARNLISNSPEQIYYEKLFAEIGWFFERKQGAWEAFESYPSRWRTLSNRKVSHFKVKPEDARTKVKKVDNEEVAQTWISFIGFSDIAVHQKSQLFENNDYYEICFLQRTLKHGAECDYKFDKTKEFSNSEAPSESLLLISFLARQFARSVTPAQRELKERTCKRLDLYSTKMSSEEITSELLKDNDYLLGLALSGMSFLFVEILGYMLYQALRADLHIIGHRFLKNGSFAYLKETFDLKEIRRRVEDEDFNSDDILCVSWFIFTHIVNEMLSGAWKDSYLSSTNRSRFLYQKDTRQRIIKGLEDLHKYAMKNGLMKTWGGNIVAGQGIYGYIRNSI
ncbi:hypothetical protein JCM14036_16530 [Desulfotomaculum defluvii]